MPGQSPGGDQIVFGMFINDQEDVYAANADGSCVAQVTSTPGFENTPSWRTSPLAP